MPGAGVTRMFLNYGYVKKCCVQGIFKGKSESQRKTCLRSRGEAKEGDQRVLTQTEEDKKWGSPKLCCC